MKTTAVKGKPGVRVKENGKFIATKSIGGKRTTREFNTPTEAWKWKNDRTTVDLKVNGKDPTLSGQGEGRNEIFFRDVYAQYLAEGMVDLDEDTAKRKKRRMDKFFPNLLPVRLSELNGRVILKHIQDMKLLVKEGSRRCNFDKEIKDLSSVLNWYDEEVTTFDNQIRRKHLAAGKIKAVPKKNKNLPPEALPLAAPHMRKVVRCAVILQFLFGSRVGEVCAINDRTVNFRTGEIDLSETIQWRSSVPYHRFGTKTDAPNRKAMTPLVREILLDLKAERPKGCKYFLQYKGKPLRYNLILDELNKALKAAGFGEFSGTHALRYAASTFARKEEGLDVAQAMLAHADARMTEGYAKLDVNEKVTGVVIKAEQMFKRGATIVQPNDNQEGGKAI